MNKQILASVLLMLLGVILVGDLHFLGHDDDASANDTDCSICDFTSEHHTDDFIPADTISNSDVVQIPTNIVQITYVNKYLDIAVPHSFLNKAPPVV